MVVYICIVLYIFLKPHWLWTNMDRQPFIAVKSVMLGREKGKNVNRLLESVGILQPTSIYFLNSHILTPLLVCLKMLSYSN